MWRDRIVEEIRKGREEHAAQYNFDIKAIIEALKEEERQSGREVVSFADKSDPPDAPPDHPRDDSQIPEYSLDNMLKDVTADNLHDEVDIGRPAGDEEW